MSAPALPAIFVGHGNPMNALADNEYTRAWRKLGDRLKPQVRAVVIVSAHWATRDGLAVTSASRPGVLYDFFGFPDALSQVRYDAPGDPGLARHIQRRFASAGIAVTEDAERALDHGVWSILVHMFPQADVPVVQISYDMHASPEEQLRLGRILTEGPGDSEDPSRTQARGSDAADLSRASEVEEAQVDRPYDPGASLRDQGVLLLTSGNIVHNLREIDFDPATPAFAWAQEFDAAVADLLERIGAPGESLDSKRANIERLLEPEQFGDAGRRSVPTADHYIPLLNFLGMIGENDRIDFPCVGIQNGSIFDALGASSRLIAGGRNSGKTGSSGRMSGAGARLPVDQARNQADLASASCRSDWARLRASSLTRDWCRLSS